MKNKNEKSPFIQFVLDKFFSHKIEITTIARSVLFILMLNSECRIRKKTPKLVGRIGIENTQREYLNKL